MRISTAREPGAVECMTRSYDSGPDVLVVRKANSNASIARPRTCQATLDGFAAEIADHPTLRLLPGSGVELRRIDTFEAHGSSRNNDCVSVADVEVLCCGCCREHHESYGKAQFHLFSVSRTLRARQCRYRVSGESIRHNGTDTQLTGIHQTIHRLEIRRRPTETGKPRSRQKIGMPNGPEAK